VVRRTRVGVLALVGTLSVPVVIAGMAWACGPSGFGVPQAPPAPPPSTAQPVAPPVSNTAPAGALAPAPVPNAAAPVQSGSGTTGSVDGPGNGGSPSHRGRPPSDPGGTDVSVPAGQDDIAARVGGATAGFSQDGGGQAVFASSAAPPPSKAGRGKSAGPAVSRDSATGDVWTDLTSGAANPSLASAAESGGQSGGLSGGIVAGIAILGLGLAGIIGGLLVSAERRRRAAASAGAPKH
jgi:hypothetical protein